VRRTGIGLVLVALVALGCTHVRVRSPGGVEVEGHFLGPGRVRVCGKDASIDGAAGRTENGNTAQSVGAIAGEGTGKLAGDCVDVEGPPLETTTAYIVAVVIAAASAAFVAFV